MRLFKVMRIFNVSPTGFNYGQNKLNKINAANRNNNVHYNLKNNPVSDTESFGMFRKDGAEKRAEEEYKKLLIDPINDEDRVWCHTHLFSRVKENPNVEIFMDGAYLKMKANMEYCFEIDFPAKALGLPEEMTIKTHKDAVKIGEAVDLLSDWEDPEEPANTDKKPEPEQKSYAAMRAEEEAYR